MRKALPILAIVTLAASCQIVSINELAPAAQELTLQASTVPDGTKTEVANDNSILWQAGDKIGIYDGAAQYQMTLTSGSGTTSGTFSGSASDADSYLCVYPYSEDNEFDGGNVTIPWYGYNQKAVQWSFDPSKAVMMARSSEGVVHFRNALSYIKFIIDFPCKSVVIEGNDEDDVLGATSVTLSLVDGIPTVSNSIVGGHGSANAKVTLRGEGGAEIRPGTYMAVVLPCTLEKGFTVTFSLSNGEELVRSTDKAVTLERNNILNIGTSVLPQKPSGFYGSGTEADPYLLNYRSDVDRLAALLKGEDTHSTYENKYYRLTQDINFQGDTLLIGGTYPFKGYFDGGGFALSNFVPGRTMCSGGLWYDPEEYQAIGLFPRIQDATFLNLTLSLATLKPAFGDPEKFMRKKVLYGCLAALATMDEESASSINTISGCTVTTSSPYDFSIEDGYRDIMYGGFVGYCGGNIRFYNCVNRASVTLDGNDEVINPIQANNEVRLGGEMNAGGLVGYVMATASGRDIVCGVDRCRNFGDISIVNQNNICGCAGLIGKIREESAMPDVALKMTNSANYGNITASGVLGIENRNAAGLVAVHDSDGPGGINPYIYNCLNRGSITSIKSDIGNIDSYVGGIMGYCYYLVNHYTTFRACVNVGELAYDGCTQNVGCICGTASGNYYNCYYYTAHSEDITPSWGSADEYNEHVHDSGFRREILSSDMNTIVASLPHVAGVDYCQWTGKISVTGGGAVTENTLDLVF